MGRSRPASLRRHRDAGAHRQRRDLGRALGRRVGRHRQIDEGCRSTSCRGASHSSTRAASNAPSGWTAAALLFAQDIVAALARHLAGRPTVTLHADARPRGRSGAWTDRHRRPAPRHDDVVVAAARGSAGCCRGPPLVPSRQVVIYFDLPTDQRAIWANSPMVIDKTGDVGLYLVPPAEGRGLKIGDHVFSRTGDPSAERQAHEEEMPPAAPLSRPDQGLRSLAHRPAEGLLLYGDRGRAFRRREAGRQGLADVALFGPRLQVRRGDGAGTGAHHCDGTRSCGACALGAGLEGDKPS